MINPELIVDLSDFNVENILGEGTYGTVYLVVDKETGEKYAAKVSKVKCIETSDQKLFFQELKAFYMAKNAAIVQFKGFNLTDFKHELYPTILTEYMPNGSLDKLLQIHPEFPNSKKYIILLGIAEGMNYLHSCGIIHRDLKPANVLLDEHFYPHIGDFGESKISDLTLSSIKMNTCKGSPVYMAPDVFSKEEYSYKADIYSYSILAYEVISGKKAFPGYTGIFRLQKDIENGKRPDLTYIKDEQTQKLLARCWSSDTNERPSFKDIIKELKDEHYLQYMEADFDEVNKYLKQFDDEIELKERTSKDEVVQSTEDLLHSSIKDTPEYYKMMADKGDPEAMHKYAKILKSGTEGVPVNMNESVRYFKMSIEKGNSDSMNNYAFILQHGKGVTADKQEAIRLYKMAIEKGNPEAMFNYAYSLRKGDGVDVNKKEAVRYYRMSADKGYPKAMHNLALILRKGDGVDADINEAAHYYKMAADKGEINSMFYYAQMLEKGEGVTKNLPEAIRYYKMAADKGNEASRKKYERLINAST